MSRESVTSSEIGGAGPSPSPPQLAAFTASGQARPGPVPCACRPGETFAATSSAVDPQVVPHFRPPGVFGAGQAAFSATGSVAESLVHPIRSTATGNGASGEDALVSAIECVSQHDSAIAPRHPSLAPLLVLYLSMSTFMILQRPLLRPLTILSVFVYMYIYIDHFRRYTYVHIPVPVAVQRIGSPVIQHHSPVCSSQRRDPLILLNWAVGRLKDGRIEPLEPMEPFGRKQRQMLSLPRRSWIIR